LVYLVLIVPSFLIEGKSGTKTSPYQLTIVGVGDDACKSIMGYAETSTTARHTHWSPKALAKLTGKTAFTIESA
jgi:hypothetical protein